MAHPQLASSSAWEVSLEHRLTDLITVYRAGIDDQRLAEMLLSHFAGLAKDAIAAGGGDPTPHAVRALADRLLATLARS